MKNHLKNPWKWLPALLAFLLTLGAATVFSACGPKDDGTWMRCHSTQDAAVYLSAGLTAALLFQAILPGKTVRLVLNGFSLIGSIVLFLLPGILQPMCMMRTMRCYTLFQPFVRIMSVLLAAFCLAALIRTAKQMKA